MSASACARSANAIGQLACLRGYHVRFVLAADLVNDLVAAQIRNTLHRRLAVWTALDLPLASRRATRLRSGVPSPANDRARRD